MSDKQQEIDIIFGVIGGIIVVTTGVCNFLSSPAMSLTQIFMLWAQFLTGLALLLISIGRTTKI